MNKIHNDVCKMLREHFPQAVSMLEDIEGDTLDQINPAEIRNLLNQCLADPDRIARAVAKHSDHVARQNWDMGR